MTWEVLEAPGLVTVQDGGRTGLAHLGVPRAGPLDRPAAGLAGRLVGNPPHAAVLEVTLSGLVLRAGEARWVAVTGAACEVTVDGRARGHGRAERVPAGAVLRLGPATAGVRSYLAVAGGWAVEPVLGSRSTDTLAWVGPPRVLAGTLLPVGPPAGPPATVEVPGRWSPGPVVLRVHPGPRLDRFAAGTLARLCATSYAVGPASDRVGLRLAAVAGEVLERTDVRELASEGMVLGAVQVPPDGQPVVLLADHPATGGYPVVAVVPADDLARVAQLRPGDPVRFRPA
ncbi:biotin-dependent carboxyltransferase family protein [Nocardioides rubriscoriae]|uniref:5-oxoprolinase subunit C family protein n=1 Tax=Nocardioides rubriscoriae TaxID=642762 RepID=UPI0011DF27B9|nr:biotin-dependent carboxyltransferase family protein [Nocardioides rubriscoriae]